MKKIIILLFLIINIINADSLHINAFAFSKHKNQLSNDQHKYLGIEYNFATYKDLRFGVELARFKNSYNDETRLLTLNTTYIPIKLNKLNIGLSLALGFQKGYCMDGLIDTQCQEGDTKKGLFVLPTLYIEYERVALNITSIDRDIMGRFSFKLYEW